MVDEFEWEKLMFQDKPFASVIIDVPITNSILQEAYQQTPRLTFQGHQIYASHLHARTFNIHGFPYRFGDLVDLGISHTIFSTTAQSMPKSLQWSGGTFDMGLLYILDIWGGGEVPTRNCKSYKDYSEAMHQLIL